VQELHGVSLVALAPIALAGVPRQLMAEQGLVHLHRADAVGPGFGQQMGAPAPALAEVESRTEIG
jgi:hypothetical protein